MTKVTGVLAEFINSFFPNPSFCFSSFLSNVRSTGASSDLK
ncbi:hypothetical protein [Clostridium botulinum]|nr:hypothetical protein [Clostridium botulinum]